MENKTYPQISYNQDDPNEASVIEMADITSKTFSTEEDDKNENVSADDLSDLEGHGGVELKEGSPPQDGKEEEEDELSEKETEVLDSEQEETSEQYLDPNKIELSVEGINDEIKNIGRTLRIFEKRFEEEILNAENRDSMVKIIYKELNDYKAGIVEKALKNVLYDIVDIREMMLSQISFLSKKKEEDTISLKEFESYADDIGDILEKHDVSIYSGEIGIENVAVRQKIVRKIETEDDTLVKKVAESLSHGYEYNQKILYPEKVSVYVKKKN